MLKNFPSSKRRTVPVFATMPVLAVVVLGAPSIAAQPIALSSDALPRSVAGTAGGSNAIPGAIVPTGQGTPPASCLGFAASQASHEFQFASPPKRLTFTVDSFDNVDTTLVVQAPDGQWFCGDDISEMDKDAVITISSPGPGAYQVWVGTFDGGYADYELTLN